MFILYQFTFMKDFNASLCISPYIFRCLANGCPPDYLGGSGAALAELGGRGVGGTAVSGGLSREPRVTMRAPSPSNLGERAASTQCPPACSPGAQANAGILAERDAEVARPPHTAR